MNKKLFLIFIICPLLYPGFVFAADQSSNPSVEQAKRDYRLFLEQLKALSSQYKQVTGEVKDVLEKEGVPTFDENTGEISMQKPDFSAPKAKPQVFGDIDVTQTDREVLAKVDLPGMKKEAIKVSIQDNKFLHIEGQRDEEKVVSTSAGGTTYYRNERQQGRFERTVELPALVKDSGTEARYENGVLTVKIPKAETPKKEVSVSVR